MKKNIGATDKAIRIFLAGLIIAGIVFKVINGTLALILGIFSGLLILTSLLNWCGLYVILGINTKCKCETESKPGEEKK